MDQFAKYKVADNSNFTVVHATYWEYENISLSNFFEILYWQEIQEIFKEWKQDFFLSKI